MKNYWHFWSNHLCHFSISPEYLAKKKMTINGETWSLLHVVFAPNCSSCHRIKTLLFSIQRLISWLVVGRVVSLATLPRKCIFEWSKDFCGCAFKHYRKKNIIDVQSSGLAHLHSCMTFHSASRKENRAQFECLTCAINRNFGVKTKVERWLQSSPAHPK